MSTTPWHSASWRTMLTDGLPKLLSDRLPLAGYGADLGGDAADVTVCVAASHGVAEVAASVPLPDEDGVFRLAGIPRVCVPTASSDDLGEAAIKCAGEQFLDFVSGRLPQARDVEWDDEALRAAVPLDEWAREFVAGLQRWDTMNPLAQLTHLRRVMLPRECRLFAPGHVGRVCPAETPENDNIGRLLTVARGAAIQGTALVPADGDPESALGPAAASLPFLQHVDPARALMACNLMRQWLAPDNHEPALVQTGLEPGDPSFWCGRNLLTAYISLGIDTFEDALGISQSAAARLAYPEPLEAGDKLSNRNGNKGVVARIIPDAQMPRLEDGTPVELCMSPNSIYSRMTFGQLREAALSWVARRRGSPFVAGPLSAPTEPEIRALLADSGEPEDGSRKLIDGRTGEPFEAPVTVGWVYWGKLGQRASTGYHASAELTPRSQRWGSAEMQALRFAGAAATAASLFGLQASDSRHVSLLPGHVASGEPLHDPAPMPVFVRLQRRLERAGIRAERATGGVRYHFAGPEGPTLRLATPLPHPWWPEHIIEEVGAAERMPSFSALESANLRAQRMTDARAPEGLRRQAHEDLRSALSAYFDAMVRPSALRVTTRNDISGRLAFSGRAVAVPGDGLAHDQVGIPEQMAWELFGPWLTADGWTGEQNDAWCDALDDLMRRRWVLVHRHPTTGPSSILAFHPRREDGRVIRIHPMACLTLNADFDGDILAVIVPVTVEAQEEAGRTLTLAAHVERDRACRRCERPVYEAVFGPMARQMRPTQDSRFGLARLCMTDAGRAEVEALARVPVRLDNDMLTTESVCELLDTVLGERGACAMLEVASSLWYRGLRAARDLGPSLTPFPKAPCDPPRQPTTDDPEAWADYQEEYAGRILAAYSSRVGDTDPARVTLLSGARGSARMWTTAVGVRGAVRAADGGLTVVRHSVSEGHTPEEALASFVGMRHGLRGSMYWVDMQREMEATDAPQGYGVLERALRSKRPGVVFARAAAAGEVDPLDTPRSRLLVGAGLD